jgi:type II secretory pathway pseudopilin PulG
VVAIIATLIAMLLPALNEARAVARTTVCLSNKRQVSLAVASYANDWKQVTPSGRCSAPGQGTRWWHEFFVPDDYAPTDYLSAEATEIDCPEGQEDDAVFGSYDTVKHSEDERFRVFEQDKSTGWLFRGIHLDSVPWPADLMTYACAARWNRAETDFSPGYPTFSATVAGPGGGWKALWTPHHQSTTAGLLADGHAETYGRDAMARLRNAWFPATDVQGIRESFDRDGTRYVH